MFIFKYWAYANAFSTQGLLRHSEKMAMEQVVKSELSKSASSVQFSLGFLKNFPLYLHSGLSNFHEILDAAFILFSNTTHTKVK